ncbi:hypothetical protein [Streptomyces niveus]|uniref:hypothetical protein n=1 Tax=Streptomyces niveus TaxID=193462 RepID=UPI0003C576F9|nr:hypothetical protein [Streptomyces niveus]EST22776.1 hypothetical protein M877_28770 [Streptomyces niveus NCIMB 11891]
MKRLIAYVHVGGVAYGPNDEVPPDVAKRIGDHAWTDVTEVEDDLDDQDDAGGGSPESDPPPRSGRGSGVEAWRTFAEQHDVEVAADASREDIVAACEAAGVVEREE